MTNLEARIKACISCLTKYAANLAAHAYDEAVNRDIRITIEQLASYYCLCGYEKNSVELEFQTYVAPFEQKIVQVRSSGIHDEITQTELFSGVKGLTQYISDMRAEQQDTYIPDILRCEKLIGHLKQEEVNVPVAETEMKLGMQEVLKLHYLELK